MTFARIATFSTFRDWVSARTRISSQLDRAALKPAVRRSGTMCDCASRPRIQVLRAVLCRFLPSFSANGAPAPPACDS